MTLTLTENERSAHGGLFGVGDLDKTIANALPVAHRAEWYAYREDWKRGAVERPFPLQLDFALNMSCNMQCPMCPWSEPEMTPGARADWMTLAFFRHVVQEAVPHGLRAVGLNGINEPLMRRDLPDFVRAARDAGVLDVMFHTNGMLLTRAMSEALMDAGLTRIMVSLDALTQPVYDQIRVGGNLDVVTRNIMEFLACRAARKQALPVLGVCFVRMAINAHEEQAFIDRWRPHVDFFAIQSYLNPWNGRADKAALAAPGWKPATTFVCGQPFQRMRFMQDGTVRPCCSIPGDRMLVGDAHRQPLEALWQSQTMRDLRQLHRAGRGTENPICRECITHSYTEEVPS